MVRRMRTLSTVVVAGLAAAGIAAAAGDARPCHPDLPGTHSLTVSGQVTGYRFAGRGTLVASVQARHCAGLARWNYTANATATASVSCRRAKAGGSGGASQHLAAAYGDRLVRVKLAPEGADRPDRLDVLARGTGHRIASWPLIDRPARVVLYGGIAILSSARRDALYALRISDGRLAILGVARAGDRPIIGRDGIVYQDGLLLKHLAASRVTLKFVPLAAVERQLSLADREIKTQWKITAIGMDDRRVAFAVHDPAGKCDVVKFWTPPWHFVARVTHPSAATCVPGHRAGGVTNVAMAGNRLDWTTRYGDRTRVLAASTIGCKEWVVARPDSGVPVSSLAGDGSMLAYAVQGSVAVVEAESDNWYGEVLSRSTVPVSAIAVDDERVATLYRNGTVSVMTEDGDLLSSFAAGRARGIALHGNTVAVLRSGRLDLYSFASGLPTHSWRVAANARSVDLYYGIAVVAAGDDVYALNVTTGHAARLLHAPGRVATQLDAPGAVVQYNAGGHGHLRFVPMSMLEKRTR